MGKMKIWFGTPSPCSYFAIENHILTLQYRQKKNRITSNLPNQNESETYTQRSLRTVQNPNH